MNLRVWSGNKKAEWRVEARWIASQQKITQESFKNQDHALLLCRLLPPPLRSGPSRICSTGSNRVNAAVYVEVLKLLHGPVRRVWPELWAEKNWILHHNNAPSHLALIVCEFFAKNDMITMNRPSYSSDLARCDFFFFCSLRWKRLCRMNILGV
jgi:hypothetical protein